MSARSPVSRRMQSLDALCVTLTHVLPPMHRRALCQDAEKSEPPLSVRMAGIDPASLCCAFGPAELIPDGRRMWSAEPWGRITSTSGVSCWHRQRDAPRASILPATYFAEALNGTHCKSNWYEGHEGQLGRHGERPHFTAPAPALLGYDDGIANFCEARARALVGPDAPLPKRGGGEGHIKLCMIANMNILNLVAGKVPYNLCRNLEWQVCAARGLLPGQPHSGSMIFANAPGSLDPSGTTGKRRCGAGAAGGAVTCCNAALQGAGWVPACVLRVSAELLG